MAEHEEERVGQDHEELLANFDPSKPLPEDAEKECLEEAVRQLRTAHIIGEVRAAQNPPACGKRHWLFAETCRLPLGHSGKHEYVNAESV